MTAITWEPRAVPVRAVHVLVLAVLVPVFLEGIDDGRFLVTIPGFPLSLGKLALVCAGLASVWVTRRTYRTSPAAVGTALVVAGCLIGAMFSGAVTANLSRGLGLGLLLLASVATGGLWEQGLFRRALDVFFLASLGYWLAYVALTFAAGGGASYSEMFLGRGPNVSVENHHIPGLYVSVCATYVALRYFHRGGRLRLAGFALFGVALASCLFIESRSNLGFTAMALLLVMLQERRRVAARLFWVWPLLLVLVFGLLMVFESSEGIQQRFEAASRERAADSRVDLLLAGVEAVVQHPLGRGVLNTDVLRNNRTDMVHNQYVTYGIAGGWLALLGCVVWLRDYLRVLLRARPRAGSVASPCRAADALTLFVMYATLLTLEFTGMLFFLVLSLGIYRSGVVAAERRMAAAGRAPRKVPRPQVAPASLPGGTLILDREAQS